MKAHRESKEELHVASLLSLGLTRSRVVDKGTLEVFRPEALRSARELRPDQPNTRLYLVLRATAEST